MRISMSGARGTKKWILTEGGQVYPPTNPCAQCSEGGKLYPTRCSPGFKPTNWIAHRVPSAQKGERCIQRDVPLDSNQQTGSLTLCPVLRRGKGVSNEMVPWIQTNKLDRSPCAQCSEGGKVYPTRCSPGFKPTNWIAHPVPSAQKGESCIQRDVPLDSNQQTGLLTLCPVLRRGKVVSNEMFPWIQTNKLDRSPCAQCSEGGKLYPTRCSPGFKPTNWIAHPVPSAQKGQNYIRYKLHRSEHQTKGAPGTIVSLLAAILQFSFIPCTAKGLVGASRKDWSSYLTQSGEGGDWWMAKQGWVTQQHSQQQPRKLPISSRLQPPNPNPNRSWTAIVSNALPHAVATARAAFSVGLEQSPVMRQSMAPASRTNREQRWQLERQWSEHVRSLCASANGDNVATESFEKAMNRLRQNLCDGPSPPQATGKWQRAPGGQPWGAERTSTQRTESDDSALAEEAQCDA